MSIGQFCCWRGMWTCDRGLGTTKKILGFAFEHGNRCEAIACACRPFSDAVAKMMGSQQMNECDDEDDEDDMVVLLQGLPC